MDGITEKQLISQLRELKTIKPRKEWAILLKSQILPEEQEAIRIPAQKIGIFNILSRVFFQRKLAYSFAVVLLLIIGVFGFAQYTMPGDLLFSVKRITEQSQAALTGQTGVNQSVAILNNRINDLAQLTKQGKDVSPAVQEVKTNISELAKNIVNNQVDSETVKNIVSSIGTLASVDGAGLIATDSAQEIFKALAKNQIDDFKKAEALLNKNQKDALAEAEDLYDRGQYGPAFEILLSIK